MVLPCSQACAGLAARQHHANYCAEL